ncbi:D-alanyl-D-alanine carboxypeptidase [Streptomyces lavendulae subsp. lavendulae]|uniref:D-alanyl-D-alanine carboxypeptidase n=1 Tax=Streptomyces lavendulae TaxID=1914 RepID=UPI0024A3FE15|nr:hypothetical protein [Streptomyces lavendulae]GLV83893.1 D-alanyl-D-alanine carboxypeptidase [Streptomyces lavendulae subsp. lavendulae]
MAGESPDKSVDEGTSGAAKSSSAEQDPRLSVFQPPPRRDALKEAVAAWVATAEPEDAAADTDADADTGVDADADGDGDGDGGTDAGTDAASGSGAGTGTAKAAATVPEPSPGRVDPAKQAAPGVVRQGSAPSEASDGPEKPSATGSGSGAAEDAGPVRDPRGGEPADASDKADKANKADGADKADGAGKPAAADSERTAVFRTLKPGSGSASVQDAKPAQDPRGGGPADGPKKPSADVRTTAFGVVVPDSGSGSGSGAAKDAEPARDPRGGEPADAKKSEKPAAADSERTAVFRTVKPGSGAGSGSAPAQDKKPAQDPRGDGPADGESERTAVFRAVKPGSDGPKKPSADVRTTAFGVVVPDSGSGSGSGTAKDAEPARDPRGGEPADAKKTEKTEKADASDKPGKPAAADSERTAVFRTVKPGSGAGSGSAPAQDKKPAQDPRGGEPADGDSERTAVFRAVKPGSAPAGEKKPADAAKGGARPSTFVPLRGDDQPVPPKPATPKPATPAPAAPATPKPAPAAPKPFATPPAPPAAAGRLDSSERTTQQPLPPRPPLDMLADLTNNPPPPPSPLRTAVRRFKIYAPIVLLLAVLLAVAQLVRPLPAPKLAMTAKATYTFAGGKPDLPWPTEGQASMAAAGLGTIGSSGEQKPVPIASVTKSMTAYIILRDHPFKKGEKGAMIDIDKTAETEGQKDKSDNESTLNTVKEGEKISEYDAIAALMIPSANNIARLLARWDSGSQEAFVKKMNDTAKELGMTNTTYTDPSGLDATTVSTAEDQVKLGLKIVEIPALVDITRMSSWTDQTGKTWPNWNRLVPYNESLGIKTGTTTKAGGNLLFAAYKKVGDTNQLIVGAVLGQHKPPIIDTVIAASRTLLIPTQKAIEGATVVKKGDVVGYVDDGLGGRTPVVATADVQAIGWSSLTVALKLGDNGTKIPETAKAGTQVGVLTVGEGASQVKVPVALQRELVAPGVGSKLTRIG